jgi:hypothetical protein
MRKTFAGLLSVGVLTLAGCDGSGEGAPSESRSPALAMPVPLSDDQSGEPEWSESCSTDESGAETCTYDDGNGTVCVVVGDADGQLVKQDCRGDWGTYDCAPNDAGFTCELTTPEGSCTDEYDASGQWVGGTCGEYYGEGEYEGGEYEEECEENEDGGYTCAYYDGDTKCTADVDASGQLVTQYCEGSWGTYDCARQDVEYVCLLSVYGGESCTDTYDLDYELTSTTCEDYYQEEPSEPTGPCSTYNGVAQCWTQGDYGYCYEFFVAGEEPAAESLDCTSTYRYVCNEVEHGNVCIYYEGDAEVCRDTIDYYTYEGEQGCSSASMGPR